MDTWLTILQYILNFSGPIIVAWFTVRMNRIAKDNAEIKRLEAEKAEREKKDLTDRIDGIVDQLNAINTKAEETAKKVSELTSVDQQFGDKIDSIVKQQRIIGTHTHKLAQLVITVATGMRDQHLNGNITHAVDSYHAFEQEMLVGMMTDQDN